MAELLAHPELPAYLALAVMAAMLVLFVRETYPVEVTAMAAAAALLLAGVIPSERLLEIFANPAPWTIAAMFVLSGGLVRTGVLSAVSDLIARHGGQRPGAVLGLFAAFVLLASAFMNNTPIVVMLIPVAVQLARSMGLAPSKLLIPLSYLAIMGGTCTLIGTSTNLLVDGVARAHGLAPFSIFEITPLGVCLAAAGLIYMRLFVPMLLPDRDSMADLLGGRRRQRYFTEVVVPQGSPLIGTSVADVAIFRREGIRVIDVLRSGESLRQSLGDVLLAEGDRVVLRSEVRELLGLKDANEVTLVDRVGVRPTTTVEALISPGCRLVGRSLGGLRLRRRYGVYPLAVHRRDANIGRQLDEVVVRVGDTLLLEGAPEDIRRLALDVDLVDVAAPSERAYRRGRSPLMVLVLAAVVGLSALGVAQIHVLALLGVALVLLARIIDADEAFDFIDGRLLALIFAMLAVGIGLEHSGAVGLIVEAIVPFLADRPAWVALLCIYLVTTVLTEIVTNNAVAVVVTPIAIALGESLGIDPRPLVIAVMIAASASFATPIGYQTNTLVYGPGGYRFADFVRVGIPMNLAYCALATLLLPLFWPLAPG